MAKTILLVDDDAYILDTAKDILEAASYDVFTAETGAAALACLSGRACDLMIADFNLKDTTGVQLAVKARELRPGMLIMLMTGEADVDLGAAKTAIHSVLTKPVNPAQLITLLNNALK